MVLWDSTGSQKTADGSRCLVKNDYKYEGWEKALRSCKSCLQVHRHDTEKKKRYVFKPPNKKEILDYTQLQKCKVSTNFTSNNDVFLPQALFLYYETALCTVTSPVQGYIHNGINYIDT